MRWLMLRGLVREARHWGSFPAEFERIVGADKSLLIDLPGVGTQVSRPVPLTVGGMTDDLRARFLKETSGAGPVGILAVSLGGMIALDWLSRFPHDFDAGVVINTSAADLSRPWERLRWEQFGRIASYLFVSELQRERNIIAMTAHRADLDAEQLAATWLELTRDAPMSAASAARQLLAGARSTLPRALYVPTLVLTSRGDRLVSHQCSERIAARLRLPIVHHQSGGHDLPLDDPQWVGDQVRSWFSAIPGRPAAAPTSRPSPPRG